MNSVQGQGHFPPYHAYRTPPPYPSCATSSFHQHHSQYQSTAVTLSLTSTFPDTADAYMNPILPPSVQTHYQLSPHHGIKRSAPPQDDESEQSNHISNQLKRLRLSNIKNQRASQPLDHARHPQQTRDNSRPLLPVHVLSNGNHQISPPTKNQSYHIDDNSPVAVPSRPSDDSMPIDETPNKIYVTNLEAEIAQIEANEREERSSLFLPDFEKQIGAIPDHVLRSSSTVTTAMAPGTSRGPHKGISDEGHHHPHQALVLYRDPSSISVPEEEDAVRKAILDSRRAIRERMRREQQRERETAHLNLGLQMGLGAGVGERGQSSSFSSMSGNPFGLDRGAESREVAGNDDNVDDGDNAFVDSDAMDIE